jgi:CysZ protein
MNAVINAFGRAARDLARGEVLWHAIWPPLVAALVWATVAVIVWADGIAAMSHIIPELPWSGWEWISRWAAMFLLLAAFATLTYVTALGLVAIVALPLLIKRIASRDYPDLVHRGENVFWGSLGNTLVAGAVFLVGGLLSLPLLLIPGVVLVLPLAWTAWLNQRTFRFDALAEHATRAELAQLVREQRGSFLGAGIGTAVAAHVPLLQILAPTYTAVVFVHLGLGALRRLRSEQGVQL